MTISPDEYEGVVFPAEGIATVGTTAFLTATLESPSELIVAALEELYRDPPLRHGLIPKNRAAEWQGLAFHPAARRYFSSAGAAIAERPQTP
jgi:hypothetical protein